MLAGGRARPVPETLTGGPTMGASSLLAGIHDASLVSASSMVHMMPMLAFGVSQRGLPNHLVPPGMLISDFKCI
jgi:hypothetical protein